VASDFPAWLRVILAVLATWRITHLLASEDGPGGILFRLRVWLGSTFAGQLIDCFACLVFWVAAPFACFVSINPLDGFVSWLALSGAALLLERTEQKPLIIESTVTHEGDQL